MEENSAVVLNKLYSCVLDFKSRKFHKNSAHTPKINAERNKYALKMVRLV